MYASPFRYTWSENKTHQTCAQNLLLSSFKLFSKIPWSHCSSKSWIYFYKKLFHVGKEKKKTIKIVLQPYRSELKWRKKEEYCLQLSILLLLSFFFLSSCSWKQLSIALPFFGSLARRSSSFVTLGYWKWELTVKSQEK